MEEILHRVEQLERNYDWLGAAESYKKALALLSENDFSWKADVNERLGYAFYRFAFQAETNEEFKNRLHQSTVAYEKAAEFIEKSNESVKAAKKSRCNAMISYICYWLTPEAKEKKIKIDECWTLTKEALAAFKEADEDWEYGKTHNQLSSSVVFAFSLNWDFQARQKMIREAVESGEQAIEFLSASEDSRELARAYARTAYYLGVFDHYFLELDEKQKDSEKIRQYWQKAKEISEDVALFEFLYPIFGAQFLLWGDATEEAITNLKKALEYGRNTRDKLIIGFAFDWLVYHGPAKASAKPSEDPEERLARLEARLQYSEDARRQFAPILFISPRTDARWTETYQADHYHYLSYHEMDLRKRRDLREKAREGLPYALRRAEASGTPEAMIFANHMFGYVLFAGAEVEMNPEVKRRFLEEGLEHEQEAARLTDMITPLLHWNRGIMQGMPAWAEVQLADLAQNIGDKKNMLLKALAHQEDGLKLCLEDIHVLGKHYPWCFGAIGDLQSSIGRNLNRLYELDGNKEHLKKATKAFAEAVESYQKVDEKKYAAESQWKAALIYDALDEHLKAAEHFALASDNYKIISERVSHIKNFYLEHANYMAA